MGNFTEDDLPYGFGLPIVIQGEKISSELAKKIVMSVDSFHRGHIYSETEQAKQIMKEINIPEIDNYSGLYALGDFAYDYEKYKRSHNVIDLDSPIWKNRVILNPDNPKGWIDLDGNIGLSRLLKKDEFFNPYSVYDDLEYLSKIFPSLNVQVIAFPVIKGNIAKPKAFLHLNGEVKVKSFDKNLPKISDFEIWD